jgi:dienelactone hydrolase
MMMGMFHELSRVLGIEVVGVEYTGYGASAGKPSAGHTYADVEAAYDFILSQGVAPDRIVAYGQSVGSGPIAWLASQRELGGIVLHSPLLSGIKVIDPMPSRCCRPSCVWSCFDFFPNDERVRSVKCPVLIMHGQKDEIIPFYHGYRLHRACPKASRWPAYFPERAGHNNLVETDARMYFGELSAFLNSVCKQAEDLGVESPPTNRSDLAAEVAPLLANVAEVGSGTASVGPGTLAAEGESDLLLGSVEATVGPINGQYEEARKGNVVLPASMGRQHDSSDDTWF